MIVELICERYLEQFLVSDYQRVGPSRSVCVDLVHKWPGVGK